MEYVTVSLGFAIYVFNTVRIKVNAELEANPEAEIADVVYHYLLDWKFHFLVLMNVIYCLLFLFGVLIVRIFFGELRSVEQRLLIERLVNYLLLKQIFLGAILEPNWNEIVLWATWFTAIAYLRIFSLLARDRLEHLTFSRSTAMGIHAKNVSFLAFIFLINLGMIGFAIHTVSFDRILLTLLLFECFILLLETLQTLIKYAIHLKDLMTEKVWEARPILIYYTEFITELLIQIATFGYYSVILFLHGLSFSLIDAVLFLHMGTSLSSLHKKVLQYNDFRRALVYMRTRFAVATPEEVKEFDDNCAICRDTLETAIKLSCGHLFHRSCLRAWLAHDNSCPTCRRSLNISKGGGGGPSAAPNLAGPPPPNQPRNPIENLGHLDDFDPARTREIIQQVAEIFPDIPSQLIEEDLRTTNSMTETIRNIVDDNLLGT